MSIFRFFLGDNKKKQARKASLAPSTGPQKETIKTRSAGTGLKKQASANNNDVNTYLAWRGGVVDIPENQRTHCVILKSGIFLYNGYALGGVVSEARALARRMLKIVAEHHVELDVIRKIYEANLASNAKSGAGGETRTERQADFLNLVSEAIQKRASDIHIVVEEHEAKIRMRINGGMRHIRQMPAAIARSMLAAVSTMASESDPSYMELEYQAARISKDLPPGLQTIRLQFNPVQNGGRYLIARLLYKGGESSEITDVDVLGYNSVQIKQIKLMRRRNFGFNVISGPTGSGKSTTLQRSLEAQVRDDNGNRNMITIEDPPEYIIQGVTQMPITNANDHESRNEAFRKAITAALRSDPDIIMIGEIRDAASATLAFQAAMSGHQVWSTVHTIDAISIIQRLRDIGVENYKVTDATLMTGLIGQRLVPTLCPHCRVPLKEWIKDHSFPDGMIEEIRRVAGDRFDSINCVADLDKVCSECDCGISGRTVVAEVILPDDIFMSHMRHDDKISAIRHWQDNLEGLTLLEHGIQKMCKGLCDPRDIERGAGFFNGFEERRRQVVFEKMWS